MPKPKQEHTRFSGDTMWITQMKGLAMLYIILFHWFGHYGTGFVKTVSNVGAQGNHIFFTLSAFGLCLSLSQKAVVAQAVDWCKWFKRRAIKLMVPYYISVAIVFVSICAYGYFTDSWSRTLESMRLNISTAMSTLFLYRNFIGSHSTAINTPWWFAIAILQFYLVFPFLYSLSAKLDWKKFAAGTFIINAAYIAWYTVYLKSEDNAFRCFPMQFLFSFSLGLIFCHAYLSNKAAFLNRLLCVKAVSLGLLLEGIGVYLTSQGSAGKGFNDLFFGLGIFLLTINLVNFASRFHLMSKFLTVLGEYSLPLFLLHAPYIYLLFPTRSSVGTVDAFAWFAVYVLFLVALTWSTAKWIFNKITLPAGGYEFAPK